VLRDHFNLHGAVLKESYIVLEGACITYAEHGRLMETVFEGGLNSLGIQLDESLESEAGLRNPYAWNGLDQGSGINVETLPLQQTVHKVESHDLCLLLNATAVTLSKEVSTLLLLSWVDREASVARRVGIARLQLWEPGWLSGDCDPGFRNAGWRRRTLKLI